MLIDISANVLKQFNMNNRKPRLIAFYLPQYHPIPENDKWWGPGFTEWTNVAKAKPLFKGHNQPNIPRDLGFYDLRVPETREKQAKLAKKSGIEGFCYWHYWFGNGKRLMNRPFDEVVSSGKPDYPFCLGWANHSWKRKTWTATGKDVLLIEQKYPGDEDIVNHFNTMLPAFKDKRYMTKDDKLIFLIWDTDNFPNPQHFFELWNMLAKKHGLKGFYFIGFTYKKKNIQQIIFNGFDSVCLDLLDELDKDRSFFKKVNRYIRNCLNIVTPKLLSYNKYIRFYTSFYEKSPENVLPCILPNWDHSPRSKQNGTILLGSTPEKFIKLLSKIIKIQEVNPNSLDLIIIKSWNEWGEGNYLEPDLKNEDSYIRFLSEFMNSK